MESPQASAETETSPTLNPPPDKVSPEAGEDGQAASDQLDIGEEKIEGEEDEEGECGFCLFMKGGGCRETFTAWEKCIEEGEKNKEDIVEKCYDITSALKKCMEAHQDYYEPVLQAEKAAEQIAIKELEKEKEEETKGKDESLGKEVEEPDQGLVSKEKPES